MKANRHGFFYVAAAAGLLAILVAWGMIGVFSNRAADPVDIPMSFVSVAEAATEAVPPSETARLAADAASPANSSEMPSKDDLLEIARRDPLELAQLARARFERSVREYQCVLIKQERVKGKLTQIQEIDLKVRQQPQTIFMKWIKNEDQCRRALFVDGTTNDKGEEVARVEPAGSIVRLFVTDIMMPIHGAEARAASRRAIDECGFGSTFELLEKYNAEARKAGVLKIRYGGEGTVDGRPTFVMIRELPFDGDGGRYPDAKMVLHFDQSTLLPVAIESYADVAGRELLGKYIFTQVRLNPGFTGDDFKF